jgi:hypothetical protein
MKNSAAVPEIVDPYATLETILKIIGRSWLTEEWRLEDIRILAQTAVSKRGEANPVKQSGIPARSSHIPAKPEKRSYPQAAGKRAETMPLSP